MRPLNAAGGHKRIVLRHRCSIRPAHSGMPNHGNPTNAHSTAADGASLHKGVCCSPAAGGRRSLRESRVPRPNEDINGEKDVKVESDVRYRIPLVVSAAMRLPGGIECECAAFIPYGLCVFLVVWMPGGGVCVSPTRAIHSPR